jgi:hypothetical protein
MGAHVTIIDERDHVGWAASATRIGELTMTGVGDMVSTIITHLSRSWRPRWLRTMRRLNVLDHGNASGIEIGSDWVTTATFSTYAPTLALLRPYFDTGTGPFGPFAHLQHCEAAMNVALMEQFADIWGVPIVGGRGLTNPVYRANTGNYVRVYPRPASGGSRRSPDTFFWGPDEQ